MSRHFVLGGGRAMVGGMMLKSGGGILAGPAAPLSGPQGTYHGIALQGTIYIHIATGALYVNEGSNASPYWTPADYSHPSLMGVYTDFRDGVGSPIAATNAADVLPRSGLRVHGDGLAETDSGLVVSFAEGGPVARATTTDEAAHVLALSPAGTAPWFQPDTHGPLVIDVEVAHVTAITLRRWFVGFLGTIADALVSPVTGATVTATLVQDDLAGLGFDTGFTAASRLYAFHNKGDEAATQDVTTGGRDTGVNQPAADTWARYRVEISRAGVMTCFKDMVQIATIVNALDPDEEVQPCVLLASTSAATKSADYRRVSMWGGRP